MGERTQLGVPVETFGVQDLQSRLNTKANGKAAHPQIQLTNCDLQRLLQYKCDIDKISGQDLVRCKPFERLFRR